MSKYVINEILKQEKAILHFFFNDRGKDIEKSMVGMLRALLFQRCEKDSAFLATVTEKYKTLKRQQRSSEVEWPLHDQEPLCEEFLRREVSVYIIIDSLDECERGWTEKTLGPLHNLTADSARGVRVLLTSRPETFKYYLDRNFKACPRIWLESAGNEYISRDIEDFVVRESGTFAEGMTLKASLII